MIDPPPPTPPSEPAPPLAGIRWSGLTHVGRVRRNNEDTFLALTFDGHEIHYLGKTGEASLTGADFVFAVSDGMGGERSGEIASRFAIDRITRLLPRSFRLSAAGLAGGFRDILIELFSEIHTDLIELGEAYEECAGMGTTLSLAWFTQKWMYFAHIGDSRIYYLPHDGGLTQLTHDHSHVGWLHRNGHINEREVRTHPRRNALQQALGAGHHYLEPHIGAVVHQPGDRFLICSDGLNDGLWDRQLDELIRTPPSNLAGLPPAQRLVEESVKASGSDNTTAVVVEIPDLAALPTP
jgi:serine/threonine protein phosphatase PrpC